MMRTGGCVFPYFDNLHALHTCGEDASCHFQANASSPFVRIYLFLVISHHVVYVFFVRRSDTSSHRAEKCMSFLIKERLHAPDGSDMCTLSEIAPFLLLVVAPCCGHWQLVILLSLLVVTPCFCRRQLVILRSLLVVAPRPSFRQLVTSLPITSSYPSPQPPATSNFPPHY